jgi:hypothetical protein
MKLIGGPGSIMAFLEEIQVPDIQVVNSEKEIGRDWETQYRNWATPKGALPSSWPCNLSVASRGRAKPCC